MNDGNSRPFTLRQRFLGAGAWLAGSQALLAVFTTGVTFILARLLEPEDYGLAAMASVFIGLLHQTSNVGLGHALVRQETVTGRTEALTFTYALSYTIVLYLVMFLAAPLVADFYGEPQVTSLLRFMSLSFVLRSFYIVPNSLLRRTFRMRQQAMVQAAATVADTAVTLSLALAGFGVWALATGPVVGHAVLAAGASLAQGWHLRLRFRGPEARELLRFAGGVNTGIFLWYWYVSADALIIGRFLGGAALGIYAMALNLSKLTWNRIWLTLNPILLPLFTEGRKAPGELRRLFLSVNEWLALLIFPTTIGLLLVAQEAVPVLLSAKWTPSASPLRWLCLQGLSRGLVVIMSPAILAVGKVKYDVQFNLACAIGLPAAFLVAVQYGVTGVAIAWAVVFPLLAAVFLLRPLLRTLGIGIGAYLASLRVPFLGAAVMSVAVLGVARLAPDSPVVILAVKILTGAVTYVAAVWLIGGNPLPEVRRLLADTRAGARA